MGHLVVYDTERQRDNENNTRKREKEGESISIEPIISAYVAPILSPLETVHIRRKQDLLALTIPNSFDSLCG